MPSVNIQSPITQRFYPKISEILNLDNLPESISFLKKDLEVFFNKVYYKNLQVLKSGNGEYVSYEVDLIFQKEIGLDLFAGIKL